MIQNVQLLRFVAAFGVLVSHAADLLIPHDTDHRWFWSVPWTAGVDLFFVISGFVMLYLAHDAFGHRGTPGNFLLRRLMRIVPPYWFFTTLTVIATVAMGGRLKGTTIDLTQIVTSYTFLPWPRADGRINPILAQGWTLNHEMFFYLAFAAALFARRGFALLCTGLILLAVVHGSIPPSLVAVEFWTRPIILEFLAGMLLARLYLAGFRMSAAAATLGLAIAITVFMLTSSHAWGDFARAVHLGIPAAIVAASVILLPEPTDPGPVRRFLKHGGDASYTLYLSHYMIVNVVGLVWRRLGIGLPWLGVALGIGMSIGVALLFFRAVERPATHWLQCRIAHRRVSTLDDVAP